MPANIAYQTDDFTLEHCDDCFIPGHLILRPQKPVQSFADLSASALTSFGKMLQLGQKAIQEVIQPERIYTLSFCEVLRDLHFHLFPRTLALTEKFREQKMENVTINGALFFDWAKNYCQHEPENYAVLQNHINQQLELLCNSQ